MPRKFTPGFIDHAAKLVSEGFMLTEIAVKLGCSAEAISKALRIRNIVIPKVIPSGHNRIDHLNELEIVNDYISGLSAKEIATKYSVSRGPVQRILRNNNISLRTASDSMFIRMSKLTPEERKALTEKSHEGSRNRSPQSRKRASIKAAKLCEERGTHRGRTFGVGELELFDKLSVRDHSPILQKALNVYSIDITFGTVAMEIRFGTSAGIRKYVTGERIKHIFEAGFKFVGVVISDKTALAEGLDQIIALLEFVDREPPSVSQYWVIKSGLQCSPIARYNGYKGSAKPAPPELVTSIRKIYL